MDKCTFSSADLDLTTRVIERMGLTEWECSRPVWEEPDEIADRCIWHADTTDKPLSQLKNTVGSGDLHGATVPSETDLTEFSFPDESGLVATDLSVANLSYADLPGANLSDADLSEANLEGADLSVAILYNADLSEANLEVADLSEAKLGHTDLPGADLREADLSEGRLVGADLSDADLRGADLPGAGLGGADLSDADLSDADLTDAVLFDADVGATLEWANLTRTDLFDADLQGAAFYGAVTTDTQLNQDTAFGAHYTETEESLGEADPQSARWCLRRIEQLADLNALPDQSREAFIQRRDLRREEAKAVGDWGEWLLLGTTRWVMGYGESFARVLGTAVAIIALATLLYPVLGVDPNGAQGLSYPPLAEGASLLGYVGALWDTLSTSLYFSVLTFTTLGFGDLQPVGLGRALATFEAGAGVTLFALLVFVLGRRSTR